MQASTLRLLRAPMLVLALACAAGGAAVAGSGSLVAQQQRDLSALRGRVAEARDQLDRVRVEAREQRAYAARFDALVARGLTDGENRLEWIEGLRTLQHQHGLTHLEYELSPRRALVISDTYRLGAYVLSGSGVEVSAGFLHEGDLLGFLDGLRGRYLGMVVPQRCALERRHQVASTDPLHPRIGLQCRLVWLSLEKRASNEDPH